MKKFIRTISFLLACFSILYAGAIIQSFEAQSNGDNIVLTWQSLDENNVKHYEILRGPDKDRLSFLTTVDAQGDNSNYTFTDENAYKTTDSFYAYGLVIVDYDGTKSEPMHVFVYHDRVSSFKRTWGSIKAIFR